MGYEFGILEWKVQVDAGKCPAQWLIPKVVSLDQTFLTNDPEQRSDVSYYLVSDLSDLEEQIIKISTEGQKEREKINKQVLLFFEERKNYHLISLNSLKQKRSSTSFLLIQSRIFHLKSKSIRKINKIVSKIGEILRDSKERRLDFS